MRIARIVLIALILYAGVAHAGRLSGRVALNVPSTPEACDTLGAEHAVPYMVHGRIMQGAMQAWEDSVGVVSPAAWELFYPPLTPGTYQASSWTTKATNGMVGCPEVVGFVVEARYKIIFGWTTVGAVWDNSSGKVIGAAEMLKRLNECE